LEFCNSCYGCCEMETLRLRGLISREAEDYSRAEP